MRKLFCSFLVLLLVCSLAANASAAKGKYLVVLQAGKESHEGTARAVHALLYSKELKEHGHEVVLLFDGAGTEWIAEWSSAPQKAGRDLASGGKPDSTDPLAGMYKELREEGVTSIICDFCANAFQVKSNLAENKVPLTAEYQGHPSIAKWADKGYQIIIL